MSKDSNVIPFKGKFKDPLPRLNPREMRSAMAGTLALILLLSVGINASLMGTSDSQERQIQRGIASVPKIYAPQWKENLKKLQDDQVSNSARPNTIDHLNFGLLKGQYSLKLESGQIRQIEFAPHSSHPQTLGAREKFLQKYAAAFVSGFKKVELVSTEPTAVGTREVYKVWSSQGESTFEFALDKEQKLQSLQIN